MVKYILCDFNVINESIIGVNQLIGANLNPIQNVREKNEIYRFIKEETLINTILQITLIQ